MTTDFMNKAVADLNEAQAKLKSTCEQLEDLMKTQYAVLFTTRERDNVRKAFRDFDKVFEHLAVGENLVNDLETKFEKMSGGQPQ